MPTVDFLLHDHRVGRLDLIVDVPDLDLAMALRPRIEALGWQVLPQVLGRVFDRLAPEGVHIEIDTLAIDLGRLRAAFFETDAAAALEAALEDALVAAIHDARQGDAGHNRRATTLAKRLQQFETFLLSGIAPRTDAESPFDPVAQLELLAAADPAALVAMLRRQAQHPYMLERLVLQLGEAGLVRLLGVLAPADAEAILLLIADIVLVHSDAPAPELRRITAPALRQLLWITTLEFLLRDAGSQFNRRQFLAALLAREAERLGVELSALLAMLSDAVKLATARAPLKSSLPRSLAELLAAQPRPPAAGAWASMSLAAALAAAMAGGADAWRALLRHHAADPPAQARLAAALIPVQRTALFAALIPDDRLPAARAALIRALKAMPGAGDAEARIDAALLAWLARNQGHVVDLLAFWRELLVMLTRPDERPALARQLIEAEEAAGNLLAPALLAALATVVTGGAMPFGEAAGSFGDASMRPTESAAEHPTLETEFATAMARLAPDDAATIRRGIAAIEAVHAATPLLSADGPSLTALLRRALLAALTTSTAGRVDSKTLWERVLGAIARAAGHSTKAMAGRIQAGLPRSTAAAGADTSPPAPLVSLLARAQAQASHDIDGTEPSAVMPGETADRAAAGRDSGQTTAAYLAAVPDAVASTNAAPSQLWRETDGMTASAATVPHDIANRPMSGPDIRRTATTDFEAMLAQLSAEDRDAITRGIAAIATAHAAAPLPGLDPRAISGLLRRAAAAGLSGRPPGPVDLPGFWKAMLATIARAGGRSQGAVAARIALGWRRGVAIATGFPALVAIVDQQAGDAATGNETALVAAVEAGDVALLAHAIAIGRIDPVWPELLARRLSAAAFDRLVAALAGDEATGISPSLRLGAQRDDRRRSTPIARRRALLRQLMRLPAAAAPGAADAIAAPAAMLSASAPAWAQYPAAAVPAAEDGVPRTDAVAAGSKAATDRLPGAIAPGDAPAMVGRDVAAAGVRHDTRSSNTGVTLGAPSPQPSDRGSEAHRTTDDRATGFDRHRDDDIADDRQPDGHRRHLAPDHRPSLDRKPGQVLDLDDDEGIFRPEPPEPAAANVGDKLAVTAYLRDGTRAEDGAPLARLARTAPAWLADLVRSAASSPATAAAIADRLLHWLLPVEILTILAPDRVETLLHEAAIAGGDERQWRMIVAALLRGDTPPPPAAAEAPGARFDRLARLEAWLDGGTMPVDAAATLMRLPRTERTSLLLAGTEEATRARLSRAAAALGPIRSRPLFAELAPWALTANGPLASILNGRDGATRQAILLHAAAAALYGHTLDLDSLAHLSPSPATSDAPVADAPITPAALAGGPISRPSSGIADLFAWLDGGSTTPAAAAALVESFARLADAGDPRLVEWLAARRGRAGDRARWAAILPPAALGRLLHLLAPAEARALHDGMVLLTTVGAQLTPFGSRRPDPRALWTLLLEQISTPRRIDVSQVLAQLLVHAAGHDEARAAKMRARAQKLASDAGHVSVAAALRRTPASAKPVPPPAPPRDRPPAARFQMLTDDIEPSQPIYIANAGLVLFHPYLPTLFDRLGLLERDEEGRPHIAPGETRSRAVHLLQYLVDGQLETAEPLLTLNKLLCGLPTGTPVARGIEADPDDLATCDGLLAALLANWPALRNTPVAGLQESFLQREGRLQHGTGRWTLQVQRKTLDVLTDQVPWSFSVVYHPWMAEPIHVTW